MKANDNKRGEKSYIESGTKTHTFYVNYQGSITQKALILKLARKDKVTRIWEQKSPANRVFLIGTTYQT